MATRKPKDNKPDDRLPGEDDIARAYREAPKEMPPATLDATILAAAQRAVARPKARGPFGMHWAVPLSSAAVIVLSLGVLLLLTKHGALNEREDFAAPLAEAPAPMTRSVPAVPEPSSSARRQDKASKPKSAPPQEQDANATRDQSSLSMESKKSESAAVPATAPEIHGRIAEERGAPARSSVMTQDKLKKEVTMTVQADVIAVQASGQPGAYQFKVTVRSPDLGCKQYADWWEVVSEDGKLLYRRVLLHSHVDEQPFTRSGGPVPIQPDAIVWVRAHMNTASYGGVAFKGSVKAGFKPAMPATGFAAGLAKQPPLPNGCDF